MKCKLGHRSCFTSWYAEYFIILCKMEEFQQKTLTVPGWNYSPDWWSGHSAETQGCCFNSSLRKQLLLSLTSWDSTTTTQFLGKRDAILCAKGLIRNQSGLMEEPTYTLVSSLLQVRVRHLRTWDGEALTPSSWDHLLAILGSLPVGQVFVATF